MEKSHAPQNYATRGVSYIIRSDLDWYEGFSNVEFYQVRFFNLTLSAGVVCVCCVCVCVTTGPFFLEASAVVFMWSNGHYGVYLGPC